MKSLLQKPLDKYRNTESKQPFALSTSNTPDKKAQSRKHKQVQANEGMSSIVNPPPKRLRTSSPEPSIKHTAGENTIFDVSEEDIHPLEYWRTTFCWPKTYFELESEINPLARKKSSSFRSKQWETAYSEPTFTTPSDQKPR